MEESLESLMQEIRERLKLLEGACPRRLEPMTVSATAKLPFKALSHREALIWRMEELSRSAFECFEKDNLASAIVLTRAAIETSAALWYLWGKLDTTVKSRAVGDIDDYLMKMIMGSRTNPDLRQAINVLTFVDTVDKEIPGFRHQYDILSEFAHPNWAGTTGLYSKVDWMNFWTDFGPRESNGPRQVGVLNLSVALGMFETSYNGIADLMPDFTALCEKELRRGKGGDREKA